MKNRFRNIFSRRDKLQDMISNQLKLEVNDTYKKYEKITTDFEPIINEDFMKKAYLDEKLTKIYGHLLILETDYIEFKLQYNKKFIEEI